MKEKHLKGLLAKPSTVGQIVSEILVLFCPRTIRIEIKCRKEKYKQIEHCQVKAYRKRFI